MENYQRYLILLIFLSLSVLFFLNREAIKFNPEERVNNYYSSDNKFEFFKVRGDSLAPLINSGETIKLVYNYYNFNPVNRGDIIVYKYNGNDAPIIKIVKAIPGDSWQLEKNNQLNSYQIKVNGLALKNSQNEFYKIPASDIHMLRLYVENHPTIPQNTYLILGNQPSGSLDSTKFGLISKNDILGKVER